MSVPRPDPTGKSDPHSAARPVPASSPIRKALGWLTRGGWYPFVIVLSIGLLSCAPFLDLALRLRTRRTWAWFALYTAAGAGLLASAGRDHHYTGALHLTLMAVAVSHALVLRRRAWPAPANSAVTTAITTLTRRNKARALAAADPNLARELHIGRPDLPHAYDDGGLVDLNTAPAPAIADACEIDLDLANEIIQAREKSPFFSIDEMFVLVNVPHFKWERIRDRSIVITG